MKIKYLNILLFYNFQYIDVFSKCGSCIEKKYDVENISKDDKVKYKYLKRQGSNNKEEDKVKISAEDITETISNSTVGFTNSSNYCYLNSGLQMLIHDKNFVYNFLNLYSKEDNNSKNNVSNELKKLILEIYNKVKKSNNKIVISPTTFKDILAKENRDRREFDVNKPNDSFYFLWIFLNNLENELLKGYYNEGSYGKYNNICYKQIFLYNVLKFNISSYKKSLQDYISALNENIKNTIIDNDKNIIIRFSRVVTNNGKKQKSKDIVHIDDTIKINDVKYYLKSVVVHIGKSPLKGHYVNFTKINGYWYCFNDESYKCCNVKDINEIKYENDKENYINKNCYYLLYTVSKD